MGKERAEKREREKRDGDKQMREKGERQRWGGKEEKRAGTETNEEGRVREVRERKTETECSAGPRGGL